MRSAACRPLARAIPSPGSPPACSIDGTDSFATMSAEGVSTKQRLLGGWAAFAAVAMNAAGLLADDD